VTFILTLAAIVLGGPLLGVALVVADRAAARRTAAPTGTAAAAASPGAALRAVPTRRRAVVGRPAASGPAGLGLVTERLGAVRLPQQGTVP